MMTRLICFMLLTPSLLWSQRSTQVADSRQQGVWEPVSYPADVYLNGVYFATPEVGWVTAGAHGQPGMIIHTTDGGVSWSAQLGDPESSDPSYHDLRFIDAHTGWVLQNASSSEYKLLHTADGQEWSPVGSLKREWGIPDYEFISATEGLYIDGNDNVSRLMRTSDGGRTWTEVYRCAATLQVEGLTKKVACALKSLHFPTPKVGYALGGAHGAKRTLFIAKTTDSGASWELLVVPDVGADNEVYFDQEAFFTSETTGVVSLSDHRIYRTTDGGRSWKGVAGTPGAVIRFADPAVGWSFSSYRKLSYTVDGGQRWTTRDFAFPAKVTAFSLPRRDRGFVVGEHGMIYRYRALGPGEAKLAKALPAPAMPAFDSPLDEEVSGLKPVMQILEQAVAAAPDSSAARGSSEPENPAAQASVDLESDEPPVESEEPAQGDVGEAAESVEESTAASEDQVDATEGSEFTASCCAKPLGKFDLVFAAVSGIVPQFLGQYRNTNLLVAGLRLLTDLPARVNELNNALRAFRKAPDKAAAMAALGKLNSAVENLTTSTAVAFQKQPSPSAPATTETTETAAGGAAKEQPSSEAAEQEEEENVEEQIEE